MFHKFYRILFIAYCSAIVGLPTSFLFAQTQKKQIKAVKITTLEIITSPMIDGVLDENFWNEIPVATDFVQFEPYNGKPATFKTEVKFAYDDNALYIGAMLYDPHPDSILTELGKRDDKDINADFFTVDISPFNDGLNAFSFIVSASGVQSDILFWGIGNQDKSWDAVWQSKVKIQDNGWVVEIKIPYPALRFPNTQTQVWGLNIWRQIRRYKEWSTWNFVDRKSQGVFSQSGELVGIEKINPPLRLSCTPYLSGYVERGTDDKWRYYFNGGADLKYGISESFTLDMTLIPDFGQVQSDEEILNLSPYEVTYQERRQFFSEGLDIFNKGQLFYTRRIGGKPTGSKNVQNALNEGDSIKDNPAETRIINATKISGRTKDKLGIGFFNAMTANTYATIVDSAGAERKFLTQPFTNYNIVALDQILKNNSFITFINTNVAQPYNKHSTNVTGTVIKLTDKKNTYSTKIKGVVSQKYDDDVTPIFGHSYYIEAAKVSGNLLFTVSQLAESDLYDINDIGYLDKNNEFTNDLVIAHNIYNPFWKVLGWYNSVVFSNTNLYVPRKFCSFDISLDSRTTFKNYLSVGIGATGSPTKTYDYYEARNPPNNVFIVYPYYKIWGWISSDYRKTFAIDISGGYGVSFSEYNQYGYALGISPRVRISDKMLLVYSFNYDNYSNNLGWVATEDTIIRFGKRDLYTITNTLTTAYIFNNVSLLSFNLRHYWSKAVYDKFYCLQDNGYLIYSIYTANHDINYNAFTIDMSYVWQFAPGSEMSIVWKNSIYTQGDIVISNFFENLDNTINSPQTNSFSVKFLYYLDYQYLKVKNRK